MSDIQVEIFCIFKTKLPLEYKIPEVPINIRSSYTENELHQILHKLLKSNKKKQDIQFDFLLNQELLRGSISDTLNRFNITTEKNIIIEYIKKLSEPKQKQSSKEDNWINQIQNFPDNNQILSLLFNAQLSLYDSKLNKQQTVNLLNNQQEESQNILSYSIKENDDFYTIISGSFFGEVFLTQINQKSNELDYHYLLSNNTGITAMIPHLFREIYYFGDQDGQLSIYELNHDQKRMNSIKNNLDAHQSSILNLISMNEFELLSCSQDDTIKIFDTTLLKSNYEIYFKDQTVTSMDCDLINKLIYTGHAQGSIKCFDDRTRNKTASMVFESQNNFVSQIKINQENTNNFISSDYNGIIRTWDRRMQKSIFSIDAHDQQKIFSLCWYDQNNFLSGGEDSNLILHEFS